ncbi:urea carboxylase-associated family protein [Palleronia sediminis]|uniref:urea carboxylase-associated family protein n=1 Tax=Palleronia sediminis TaxID=2547833 RepID=UPI001F0E7B38|nr:urea carboxylase-associated family protein [Palleronia sediminis]
MSAPADADARRAVAPVICYPTDTLPAPDPDAIAAHLEGAEPIGRVDVPPRDARAIRVPRGTLLRISCPEGAQVGDLNLFAQGNLDERFFAGKTRALHGTHLDVGARMWSCFPYLRPMATLVADSLDWYGTDPFGGRVHDVIGTRCDPYTARLLGGGDYHHCCHSNLTRALAAAEGIAPDRAEALVHDVLNVFMCTGFTAVEGLYFMKASPARKGDRIDLLAEIDLLAVLSACPGGDCGSAHSSDTATCHPLRMEVLSPGAERAAAWPEPPVNAYDRSHGL